MTELEVKKLNLITQDGIFPPIYTYEDFIFNEETEEYEYIGLVIQKTAQEVYNEWLYNRDNPIEPSTDEMEVLTARVDGLENINAGLLFENAEHQIKIKEQEKMNKEQEVTNANLLLEIAMLKGEML